MKGSQIRQIKHLRGWEEQQITHKSVAGVGHAMPMGAEATVDPDDIADGAPHQRDSRDSF